jgi:hypothetical protein
VGGDVSGDEAVWRDLIARYEMPAAADAGSPPWPERENLELRPGDPSLQVTATPPELEPGSGSDEEKPPEAAESPAAQGPAADRPAADHPAADHPAADRPAADRPEASGADDRPGPGPGGDRTRVIRHASPVPRPSGADAVADEDEDEDDRYVPPPPPPLPQLDPVGKGAWTALFGGPAYLVLATFLGWSVSSWAALAAVSAFVGGFAVVIVRMGDGPSRGDGPDNGAVL